MTLDEIQCAIAELPPDELAKFRDWFVEFEAKAWDCQIKEDVKAGRLDFLAEEALDDHRTGQTTDVPATRPG